MITPCFVLRKSHSWNSSSNNNNMISALKDDLEKVGIVLQTTT